MNNTNLQEILDFVIETAYQAGKLTLEFFQSDLKPDFKTDDSPVTIADRKAEEFIRSRIEKQYPKHSIIGEEFGVQENDNSSHRWYIDPIDGTKSFIRGIPIYSILIGLEIEGTVEVGAAYFPALDEMIAAATGLGCWWNKRRAYVSEISTLDKSVLVFSDVNNFPDFGRAEVWERLRKKFYFRSGMGDAYGHMLVATGRAELMLDPVMSDWDCGPFPPILREAGGFFGDWKGNETIHSREALSTTKTLLPQVLEVIGDVK